MKTSVNKLLEMPLESHDELVKQSLDTALAYLKDNRLSIEYKAHGGDSWVKVASSPSWNIGSFYYRIATPCPEELLVCPFCGHKPRHPCKFGGQGLVKCSNDSCGMSVRSMTIKQWQKRSTKEL